jgi:hypothetical protein
MNATVPPANNPRLSRIRKISRLLKIAVLIYMFVPLSLVASHFKALVFKGGMMFIFGPTYAHPAEGSLLAGVFAALGTGLCLLGIVSFYRLLGLYEKGVFFASANVAEMKKLAGFLVFYGLLGFATTVLDAGGIFLPWSLLGIVASPWIVAGGAVYLVAWIMDEGRKIQEEQELTV